MDIQYQTKDKYNLSVHYSNISGETSTVWVARETSIGQLLWRFLALEISLAA